MSFNRVYESIVPSSIAEQIKAIEQEIYVVAALNKKRIARNEISPTMAAIHMHGLRSILVTLRAVRDGELIPNPAKEPPARAAEVQHA